MTLRVDKGAMTSRADIEARVISILPKRTPLEKSQ